jgi:hypothetical protein
LSWFPDKKKQWENWVKTGVEKEENNNIPVAFKLKQNYPNPFNPKTQIDFSLAKSGSVSLKVYNVLGREIATLINKELGAGSYKVNFDANGLSSGIYFYRLEAGGFTSVKKMMLMK